LDLSSLNKFVRKIKFKMETVSSIRKAIRPGDWATSVDLTDAYFHVLIHPRCRRWLRFVWKGVVYQFRALPFGLTSAPFIFTKMVASMAAGLTTKGIRLKCYLDDWLNLHNSRNNCLKSTSQVVNTAQNLGFVVNEEKSDLVPSQHFVYLGMVFNTQTFSVAPTPERVLQLQSLIREMLHRRRATVRRLLSVLGQMESMAMVLPLGRVMKRPLQRAFKRFCPDQSISNLNKVIVLGAWFSDATESWLDPELLRASVPIRPLGQTCFLYTDASNQGWGAHCLHHQVSGLWCGDLSKSHINFKELEAVFRALRALRTTLEGKWVTVCTDNATALAYLKNQGGTVSSRLSMRAEEILHWCHLHNILLSVRFVPGRLNTLADKLSRKGQILKSEWSIHHNFLQSLWDCWGKPMIDLFATRYNNRLLMYVSPFQDPAAWRVDALSFSWTGLSTYAYPPISLIQEIVEKWSRERPRLVLVTPFWPTMSWLGELMDLVHVPPRKLNISVGGLRQTRNIVHQSPHFLDLTGWLLCEQNCEHEVFRTSLVD
jgi:hypothetical protein